MGPRSAGNWGEVTSRRGCSFSWAAGCGGGCGLHLTSPRIADGCGHMLTSCPRLIACCVIIAMNCQQAISPGGWHREWQSGMGGQWAQSEANGLFCAEEETWVPLCHDCLAYRTGFFPSVSILADGQGDLARLCSSVLCRGTCHGQVVSENGRVSDGGGGRAVREGGRGQTGVRAG